MDPSWENRRHFFGEPTNRGVFHPTLGIFLGVLPGMILKKRWDLKLGSGSPLGARWLLGSATYNGLLG